MQKRRVVTVAIGAVLCLSAIAAAQDDPRVSASAGQVVREQPGRITLTGNVVLTIDGVVVRADRAVIQDREVTLEGNVRLTLPKRVYTAAAMRTRIDAPLSLSPELRELLQAPSGPRQIDTPIPQPWQPPPGNQR